MVDLLTYATIAVAGMVGGVLSRAGSNLYDAIVKHFHHRIKHHIKRQTRIGKFIKTFKALYVD